MFAWLKGRTILFQGFYGDLVCTSLSNQTGLIPTQTHSPHPDRLPYPTLNFTMSPAGGLDYCKIDWRSPTGNPLGRNVITGVRNQLFCCEHPLTP